MSQSKSFIISILLSVLLLAGGFAVYGLVKLGVAAGLSSIGITSEALQFIIIIVVVILALMFTGVGFRKALKRLLG